MSPINLKKLALLRKKIDLLDNQMFKIIVKRTFVVQQVLKLKTSKKEIIDRARIKKILQKIRRKSKMNKIDVKITNNIWKNIIWSYINFEKRNFKKK